ncbi:MAG: OmpA family protein [Bdellovibrionales bacterium]|nr:OmpA family protein [Bdellovibrionales bacterium]
MGLALFGVVRRDKLITKGFSTMKGIRFTLSAIVLSFGLSMPAQAQDLLPEDNGIFTYHQSPEWRESESHPLRITAYVLHPVGWVFREAIFRPWSALVSSTKFTRSFFGYRYALDYREPDCFGVKDYDCHKLPPMTQIGGYAEPSDGMEGGEGDAVMNSGAGERQVFFPDVNFEFDRAKLTDLGKGRVRQISQLLASVPSLNIVVEGHTDYMGTDEYNNSLGERRASAVMSELQELGIDPARMSTVSYGESRPIFAEEEDWARAVNRRVQFSVQGAS